MKCCESVVLGSGKRGVPAIGCRCAAAVPRPLCPPGWVNRRLRPVRGAPCAGPGGEPGIVAATVRADIVCGAEREPLFR